MLGVERLPVQRYSVAALLVLAALLPMLLLKPLTPMQCSPLMLGFAAVIVSAWYGGLGPGLLAVALVIPAIDYFFISPIHSLTLIDRAEGVQLVMFSLVSLLSIFLKAAPKAANPLAVDRLSKLSASEAKFRSLFDSNIIGVLFSDLKGNITEANDAFLNMVGYTQAELLAGDVRWDKMTPVEYRHLDEQAIAELQESGVSAPWEKEYIHSDGNRVSVLLACALLEGSEKNCVSFVFDLTQRQRAEKELQQLYQQLQDLNRSLEHQVAERTADLAASQAQMQAVMDHIPAFIYITGVDGRLQFVNARWRELASRVEDNPIGRHLSEIFTPAETAAFLQQNQSVAVTGQAITFECDLAFQDGVRNFLDARFPLQKLTGEVYAVGGVALDVTDRKRMETALKRSEQQLRAIVDNVPLGLYTCTQGFEFVNQYWLSQMGLTLEEARGMGWTQAIHPLDRGWVVQQYTEAENASQRFEAEYRFIDRNGNIYWMLDRAVPIRDETEQFQFYQGFLVDITERRRAEDALQKAHDELEMRVRERTTQLAKANEELLSENKERQLAEMAARQSEERYRILVEQAADCIFISDLQGNYLDVNTSCCSISGYSREELLGMCISDTVASVDMPEMLQAFSDLQLGKNIMSEWGLKCKDGTIIPIEVNAKMLPNGQIQCIARNITQRKQAEYELRHNAFHDPLTALPNRALFTERLGHAVQQAKRHKDYLFAVLFLDLDRFKVINDSLGHLLGDQFLIIIAGRLKACLRLTDTAARLGGDEFTILLEGINDVSDALRVTKRIQKELALPIHLGGQEVFATASIGIALSATGYDRPEDLLRDADTAMYRAKALGKARYEIFNTDMHVRAMARLQLETDLRKALERQEFRLQYQPIVSLSTGRIVGFEALVRWQHPQHGLQMPSDFIAVAEETGLIIRISQWVLRVACTQLRTWQLQLPTPLPLTISVNLCSQQLTQPDLSQQIQQILQETGLDASNLRLEITEGAIMESAASATATLWQLRALGVQLSIDDFGTGYSSLDRLHQFPINGLKIDRSFVSRMGIAQRDREIVDTIVTLAHKLSVDVTAEGVETQEQLTLLRWLACEYGQGYFFSQPLDTTAAEELIATNPQW